MIYDPKSTVTYSNCKGVALRRKNLAGFEIVGGWPGKLNSADDYFISIPKKRGARVRESEGANQVSYRMP